MTAWFTPSELAELKLPTMPATRQGVEHAREQGGWRERCNLAGDPLARKRPGAKGGGGWEYHFTLLPPLAIGKLAVLGLTENEGKRPETGLTERDARWALYDALPEAKKKTAEMRADALRRVEAITRSGVTKHAAVTQVAGRRRLSNATIYNWFKLVEGLKRDERLPALAPKHSGRSKKKTIDPAAWNMLVGDYLRLSQPSFESCYERLRRVAPQYGWDLPSSQTLRRRIEKEIPEHTRVLKREGKEKLDDMIPRQTRDRSHFHALEAVNVDGHTVDVFVQWPGVKDPVRVILVAVQDLFSGKIVAYRIDRSENRHVVRLVFADMFRDWGIPDKVWLDNGRAFASKFISGGSKTRYRGKVRDEEPQGVLTAFGCEIHWASPYSGRSKPIERAFRDLADRVAKHPAFEGAYTGNKPTAKPANYRERAIPLDEFKRILDEEIIAHNARQGRKSQVCGGVKSFDEAFNESYATAPIRRASEAQLRQTLLAVDSVSANRKTGAVRIFGNDYWTEDLNAVRGQKVMVRFDPDDLTRPVHVYRHDGSFVATAEVWEMAGFDDAASAHRSAKMRRDINRKRRETAELEVRLSAAQVAAKLPRLEKADAPDAKVVQLINTRQARSEEQPEESENQEEFIDEFARNVTALFGE